MRGALSSRPGGTPARTLSFAVRIGDCGEGQEQVLFHPCRTHVPELGQLAETGLPVSLPSDQGWVSVEAKCNEGWEKLFKVSVHSLHPLI